MKKNLLALLTLFTALSADEPSVFGAGDLNSPSPYGLTQTEKYIVQNRDALKDVKQVSNTNSDEIALLKSKLDGINSIVEGLSQKSQQNKVSFNSWLATYDMDSAAMKSAFEMAVAESEKKQAEIHLTFQQDLQKLTTVITELSHVIDTINANYVSKEELNRVVTDVNDFKDLLLKELKKVNKPAVDPLTKMENFEIEKKANELYNKRHYTTAIEYFEYLIEKNYKPARSHYMIGEMYYYRKNYKKAIDYFKESATRYSKAEYMPTLMLHSALSMKRSGDKQNGEKFLEALVVKYPDSKAAKIAKKELIK